jgi:hypothetical protein
MSRWPSFVVEPIAIAKEGSMNRVDGYYVYSVGFQIHPLSSFTQESKLVEIVMPLIIAEGALDTFLSRSIFKIRTSLQAGHQLLGAVKAVRERALQSRDPDAKIEIFELYTMNQQLQNFEAVLAAELGLMDIYLVAQKGGLATSDLINNGEVCFAAALAIKVPEAVFDVREATKCIAYEVGTAAGFHLHRANESVLHRYYDAVTGGKPRPPGRNIGDHLHALNTHNAGDSKVRSALKDLKDMHRNPLIHPEAQLTVDEAIDLLGMIRAVVGQMLKEIPEPPTVIPPTGL